MPCDLEQAHTLNMLAEVLVQRSIWSEAFYRSLPEIHPVRTECRTRVVPTFIRIMMYTPLQRHAYIRRGTPSYEVLRSIIQRLKYLFLKCYCCERQTLLANGIRTRLRRAEANVFNLHIGLHNTKYKYFVCECRRSHLMPVEIQGSKLK